MGHGDELAIVDRGFPAAALAQRLIYLTGHGTGTVARAVFTVFPIDSFVQEPIVRMRIIEAPDEIPAVQAEFLEIAESAEERAIRMGALDRYEFYERVRGAFAVILTGESRGYANFLISKGGVAADNS